MGFSPSQTRILRELLRRPEGQTLTGLASLLDVTPPTLLRQLDVLVRLGCVEKSPGREPRSLLYRAQDYLEITGIDTNARHLIDAEAPGPFSWRFPLVSRVRDAAARFISGRLLDEADRQGLLHPWLHDARDRTDPAADIRKRLENLRGIPLWDAKQRFLRDPSQTWIVFGSCARGDAGASSDIDLVVLEPGDDVWPSSKERLLDLIADANLAASRRIDAHVIQRENLASVPAGLQNAIRREGVTIYASFTQSVLIESWRP